MKKCKSYKDLASLVGKPCGRETNIEIRKNVNILTDTGEIMQVGTESDKSRRGCTYPDAARPGKEAALMCEKDGTTASAVPRYTKYELAREVDNQNRLICDDLNLQGDCLKTMDAGQEKSYAGRQCTDGRTTYQCQPDGKWTEMAELQTKMINGTIGGWCEIPENIKNNVDYNCTNIVDQNRKRFDYGDWCREKSTGRVFQCMAENHDVFQEDIYKTLDGKLKKIVDNKYGKKIDNKIDDCISTIRAGLFVKTCMDYDVGDGKRSIDAVKEICDAVLNGERGGDLYKGILIDDKHKCALRLQKDPYETSWDSGVKKYTLPGKIGYQSFLPDYLKDLDDCTKIKDVDGKFFEYGDFMITPSREIYQCQAGGDYNDNIYNDGNLIDWGYDYPSDKRKAMQKLVEKCTADTKTKPWELKNCISSYAGDWNKYCDAIAKSRHDGKHHCRLRDTGRKWVGDLSDISNTLEYVLATTASGECNAKVDEACKGKTMVIAGGTTKVVDVGYTCKSSEDNKNALMCTDGGWKRLTQNTSEGGKCDASGNTVVKCKDKECCNSESKKCGTSQEDCVDKNNKLFDGDLGDIATFLKSTLQPVTYDKGVCTGITVGTRCEDAKIKDTNNRVGNLFECIDNSDNRVMQCTTDGWKKLNKRHPPNEWFDKNQTEIWNRDGATVCRNTITPLKTCKTEKDYGQSCTIPSGTDDYGTWVEPGNYKCTAQPGGGYLWIKEFKNGDLCPGGNPEGKSCAGVGAKEGDACRAGSNGDITLKCLGGTWKNTSVQSGTPQFQEDARENGKCNPQQFGSVVDVGFGKPKLKCQPFDSSYGYWVASQAKTQNNGSIVCENVKYGDKCGDQGVECNAAAGGNVVCRMHQNELVWRAYSDLNRNDGRDSTKVSGYCEYSDVIDSQNFPKQCVNSGNKCYVEGSVYECNGSWWKKSDSTDVSFLRCGSGNGDKKCPAGYCCSRDGRCGCDYNSCNGSQSAFDGAKPVTNANYKNTCLTIGTPAPTKDQVQDSRTAFKCGPDYGERVCDSGCCNSNGECGTGSEFCKNDRGGEVAWALFDAVSTLIPMTMTTTGKCGPTYDANGNIARYEKCPSDQKCSRWLSCGTGVDHLNFKINGQERARPSYLTQYDTAPAPAPAPAGATLENKQTSRNEKGGLPIFLDRHDVDCGNKAINQAKLNSDSNSMWYTYTCVDKLLNPSPTKSQQNSVYDGRNNIFRNAGNYKYDEGMELKVTPEGMHSMTCKKDDGTYDYLTQFQYKDTGANQSAGYKYTCKRPNNPAPQQCNDYTTAEDDRGNFEYIYLDRHDIKCPDDRALAAIELMLTPDNNKTYYKYTCCT